MEFAPRFISLFLTSLLIGGPSWAQAPASDNLQLRVTGSDGAEIVPGSRSSKGFLVEVTDGNGARVSDAAVVFRLPDSSATGTFADGSHAAVAYTDATGIAHISDIQWSSTPGPVALRITATRGTAHAGILVEENLRDGSIAGLSPLPKALPTASPEIPREARQEAMVKPGAAAPIASDAAPATPAMIAPAAPRVQISNDIEPTQRNLRPSIAPVIHESGSAPSVSISNNPGNYKEHGSKKKWIIIAGIAAAAGAGAFLATRSQSSSSSATTSGPTIGAPSISIGR